MSVAVEPIKNRRARRRARQAVNLPAHDTGSVERRYRQRIKHIDLWSVLKVSLCFYIAAFLVAFATAAALWVIAAAFGILDSFENFMEDMLSAENYNVIGPQVALGAILIGLVLVALMTVSTVIAAAFYNLFAELLDGVEVVVVEDELTRSR